jgi:hypothetical protein
MPIVKIFVPARSVVPVTTAAQLSRALRVERRHRRRVVLAAASSYVNIKKV